MADERTDSLDVFAELLSEHSRLLEEKASIVESRKMPPTTLNFRLTQIIDEVVERAEAQRAEGREQGNAVRTMLNREAENGSLAAADAVELLAEEDPFWRIRGSR